TTGARPPGGNSPLDPVHSGKYGSDTVGDHRGHCPAPGGIGPEPTRRDRTKGLPERGGLRGGEQAHQRAGPRRDTALPPGVPSGISPAGDTINTVPPAPGSAAVSRLPGRVPPRQSSPLPGAGASVAALPA